MCFKRESLGRHDGGAGTTIISSREHDGRLVRHHLARMNVFGVILDKEMREFMGVNGGHLVIPTSRAPRPSGMCRRSARSPLVLFVELRTKTAISPKVDNRVEAPCM
jgi:hypothetical protein